ncbi:TetR/AcrR family transcriptional regulator [Curtobacterium sp. SL109]|uniref:TetR/AcrR family transcriptional regulator n=1 Tax=Curtobacterium sp. SL109 TaxID=2994662 RepID=UPI002273D3AE|nr:TetR/AcrR family transcriptional regulator [Curtobacterium sp. SL109]MCY1693728.1 helix-turn-helix domain containing protein [Curtobacterium sp. SL109]
MTETTTPNVRGVLRRASIIDAARALFSEVGYRGATMAQIAARADVTHAGLLYHFSTKDAVLDAVLAEHRERTAVLAETPEGDGDYLDRLDRVVAQNANEADWMRLSSLLLGEAVALDHPLHGVQETRYQDLERRITTGLLGVSHQPHDNVALAPLARLLIAAMDGLQLQATLTEVDAARAARMRSDFSVMIELIRARLDTV